MTLQVFPAHIAQSNLNGEVSWEEPINLLVYIIEDYDPKMLASRSICLSNKTNSILNSTSSVEPEKVTFEEKLHPENHAATSTK